MIGLSGRLRRVFDLLKRTQPVSGETDVVWWGPYFIPRPGMWVPSHFSLYRGTLYCRLFLPPDSCAVSWEIGSREVKFERGFSSGDYYNDEPLWAGALSQIERRLLFALKDFDRYNRLVERRLPPSCRTGKLRRRLSWPKNARGPLSMRRIRRLEKTLRGAASLPALQSMTLSRYLETTAAAYDAVFKELRSLTPFEKYKRKADGRHGGLLDLPPGDAEAFAEWFHSDRWAGTHPWEIVFGHPHGIMISPRHEKGGAGWRFALWVDSPGWYADAARMASALGEKSIAFDFLEQKKVLDALKGIDEVEIGPGLYKLSFDELKKERPDAVGSIAWDEVPRLSPITPDQAARIPKG